MSVSVLDILSVFSPFSSLTETESNSKFVGTIYKRIAESYSMIYISFSRIEEEAKSAAVSVVDITGTSYEYARQAEIALLDVFNSVYLSSKNITHSLTNYISPIRKLNGLVIEGSVITGTNQEKLDYFINNEVEWDNGCVPFGWYQLCYMAGYNVENWNVCS